MPQKYAPSLSSSPSSSAPSGGHPPIKKLRLGAISASIWRNDSDKGVFYSVNFSRSYLDAQKNFHDTDSFKRDDLPLVAKLADQAHSCIFQLQSEKPA